MLSIMVFVVRLNRKIKGLIRRGLSHLIAYRLNRMYICIHCSNHVAFGTAGDVAYLAWALCETIEEVAKFTTTNALRFSKQLRISK
jgi:hypothetical protein